jgi:hypothetical protein
LGEAIERFEMAELDRDSFGLAVAAEDIAAGGIIRGDLPDRCRRMDRCPSPRPRFDACPVRYYEKTSLCWCPPRH